MLTVDDEDDGFGLGSRGGLSNVGWQAANLIFTTSRRAAMDNAGEAAGGHAGVVRHDDGIQESIDCCRIA